MYIGTVIKGGQEGTALGFPTANIALSDTNASGIYASRVTVAERTYNAVSYADQKRRVLESHLFDFSDELYGQAIRVELLEKLRDVVPFSDADVAREQIGKDVEAARRYFKRQ